MSARNDLWALLESKCYAKGHDPGQHIDAYRAEVLREAAARIRVEIRDPNPLASLFSPFAGTLAADLIDPDKGES